MSRYLLAGGLMVAKRHPEVSADALPDEASTTTHIGRFNMGMYDDQLGSDYGGMQHLRTGLQASATSAELSEPETIEECPTEARVRARGQRVSAYIDAFARRAISGGEDGDLKTATRAIHRLSAFHDKHPGLLCDSRFNELRTAITRTREDPHDRPAAKRLAKRQSAVADEIKRLAHIVQKFHKVARTIPHDHEDYRRAKEEYRQAVRDLTRYDTEWFISLVLETADLLNEWSDAPASAQKRVDRFLDNVDSALSRLRKETQGDRGIV